MFNLLSITLLLITLITLVGVIWLSLAHKKIRRDYDVLRTYVEQLNKDIAGLCSAALTVDSKLSDNIEQIKDIVEKVADFEQFEQPNKQSYHSAIQKVKQGVSADELIQQCGISREEAILLIRLHGNDG